MHSKPLLLLALLAAVPLQAQTLTVSPTTITASGIVGGAVSPQRVTVRNTGTGPRRWTITPAPSTWVTVSPLNGRQTGTVTAAFNTSGLPAGTYQTSFVVTANQTVRVFVTFSLTGVAAPPPPPPPPPPPLPPPPTSTRGPQPTILCPSGSIAIAPGADIQAAVNAQPAGASFCLKAGIHPRRSSITPKSGNTFTGEYGAILDGTGWVSLDATQAAFRAHNEDINNVTIRNLVIRHMPQYAIRGSTPFTSPLSYTTGGADGWVIEYNELAYNLWGVNPGNASIVRYNNIHHNDGHTQAAGQEAFWGGGLTGLLAADMLIEHNEFAYNGANQRIIYSRNAIFRFNYVHHNAYNGIWFDGENTNASITDNVIEDHLGHGVMYEVSGSGTIARNTIRRAADSGILVSLSHGVTVYNNTIEDSGRGINLFVDIPRVGGPYGGLEPFSMQDVNIHDNSIRVRNAPDSYAALLSAFGGDSTPYANGSKNIRFTQNSYAAPSTTGSYFIWIGAVKTFAAWQALGQDVTGTVTVR